MGFCDEKWGFENYAVRSRPFSLMSEAIDNLSYKDTTRSWCNATTYTGYHITTNDTRSVRARVVRASQGLRQLLS